MDSLVPQALLLKMGAVSPIRLVPCLAMPIYNMFAADLCSSSCRPHLSRPLILLTSRGGRDSCAVRSRKVQGQSNCLSNLFIYRMLTNWSLRIGFVVCRESFEEDR